MEWPDTALDPGLKRPLPEPYVYPSKAKRLAAASLDACGELWMAEAQPPLDWNRVRRVAVLRLDHLGDLLHVFPALQLLRSALPHAAIDLFTGPWGAELGALCPSVDRVVSVDAPWFNRPERRSWPWKELGGLSQKIREGRYDLALEFRGDLRHHLALWGSGTPRRAGHAITAGRFLLTHPVRHDPRLHEIDQNISLLRQIGLPEPQRAARPLLRLPAKAVGEARRVQQALKLGEGYIALQAACGTPAKRWPLDRWSALIGKLPAPGKLVLLGSANERAEMEALAAQCPRSRRPAVAAGMLSLSGLAAFLKKARLLISVDSGPAHLAAALGTPVLALQSGTNRVEQWGVVGKGCRVLQAPVPCSPCELVVCPYDNECMRRIESVQVLQALGGMA